MNSIKKNISYVWDENLIKQCDRLPAVLKRASIVHELIEVYGLIPHLKIIRSTLATYDEMKLFHSELYLDHLKTINEIDEEEYEESTEDEKYGIGYDCEAVSNMYELVSAIAGGSLTGAKSLILGVADIAINWCGGWHHGQKNGADGFCYVNDIVIAIEMMRRKFPKVLYVDLDVHHGNGVQDAYATSKSVFTLSIHRYEPGFYPGSGGLSDIGSLDGTGYSCNIPLKAGYTDDMVVNVFDIVFDRICTLFSPDAIVVQCGGDALAHDLMGEANLTIKGYCSCIKLVIGKEKPTLLLGGGGYNTANTARLWTSITALLAGVELDENIPEHHNYWNWFRPGYVLTVEPALAKNCNTKEYLDYCIKTVLGNLDKYLGGKQTNMQHIGNESQASSSNNTTNAYRSKLKLELKPTSKDVIPKSDIYEFTED